LTSPAHGAPPVQHSLPDLRYWPYLDISQGHSIDRRLASEPLNDCMVGATKKLSLSHGSGPADEPQGGKRSWKIVDLLAGACSGCFHTGQGLRKATLAGPLFPGAETPNLFESDARKGGDARRAAVHGGETKGQCGAGVESEALGMMERLPRVNSTGDGHTTLSSTMVSMG